MQADTWQGVLDFIPTGYPVCTVIWPPQEGGLGLSALRALRVMRPLRAVTKFPELKQLVVVILKSIPKLSSVVGLCAFIFFVFGILGVQLFAGRPACRAGFLKSPASLCQSRWCESHRS